MSIATRNLAGLAIAMFTITGIAPAQNSVQNNAQNPNIRPDPNANPADLAGQGGPGFINNPSNRPPYDLPDNKISDKQFLERAVMRGLTQIELGKLAVQKASSDDLKKFGQKMIDDHTRLNTRLARLAGREGMAVPGSLDSRHQARVDRLTKLSGEDFDRAYIKDQIKGQERDAQAFAQESQEGSDAAVRTFAVRTLPEVEKHYDALKAIDKSRQAKR